MLDRHLALLARIWFVWLRPPSVPISLVLTLTLTAPSSTLLALPANLNSVTWSPRRWSSIATLPSEFLDFALQQDFEARTRPESAAQSPMETDNSPPIFDLPLFSLSPSLAPTSITPTVTTTGIPPVVATSPVPPRLSIPAPPSASRAPPFVYQPIRLPPPPPIASTDRKSVV